MIKNLKLLILLLFIGSSSSFATHILGGELTYKYLGSDGPADRPFRYLIRFVGYVDRVGTPGQLSNWGCGNLGQNPRLAIYDAGTLARISKDQSSQTWSLPFHGNQVQGTCDIDPYYGGVRPLVIPVPPACVVPGLTELNIAITDTTFEVQLPLSASGYRVKYENCCRTEASTNIFFPGGGGGPGNTWLATIPSPIFTNSSPQFIGDAVPFFCLGDTATISNNAFDPDGDRLIYSFAQPFSDDGDQQNPNVTFTEPELATYQTGYDVNAPFGVNGYATINPSTGLTRYYSPIQGNFAVAIDIQEYRTLSNGTEILLSTTRREFLVVVKPCADNPPPTPVFTSSNVTLIKNEGDSVVFVAKSFDVDTTEISAISELLIPGNPTGSIATCPAVIGVDTVQTIFRWKIDCGITKGQTRAYSVQVNYKDRGCPPKTETVIYTIIVNPFKAPPITGKDSLCSTGSSLTFSAPAGTVKNWKMLNGNIIGSSTGNTVQVSFPGDTARVKLIVTSGTGCKDSTSKKLTKVQLVPVFATAPSPFVCQDSSITLNATGGYSAVSWSPSSGLSSTVIRNPKAILSDTASYIVTSNGPAGCIAKDTIAVKWIPRVANAGPDSILCSGLKRTIGADQPTLYNYYSYQWLPSSGVDSDTSFKTIATLVNSGVSNQTFTFVQRSRHRESNCISTDTVRLSVKPLPIVNAGPDTATICSGAKTIIGTAESASATYVWSPTNGLLNTTKDTTTISLNPDSVGVQFYKYFLTKTEVLNNPQPGEPVCINSDSIVVRVNPLPFFNLATQDSICSGFSTSIGTNNQTGFSYAWSPPRGLTDIDSSSTNISLVNPGINPGDTTYSLLVTNSLTGCNRSKNINIRVNPLPVVNVGSDVTICSGDTVVIGELNQVGFGYAWTPGNGLSSGTESNPKLTLVNTNVGGPSLSFNYKLTKLNNQTKCRNFDSLDIKVKALPSINAGADTVTICSGSKALIGTAESVSGIYLWTPNNGLLNPNKDTTTVSLNPDSVNVQYYTFKLKKTEGIVLPGEPACSNFDSAVVRVNPLPFFSLASKDSICSGLSTTIGTTNQIGFSYAWAPTRGLTNTTGSQTSINLINPSQTPGDTIYKLLVTNSSTTCARTKQINIRVNPLPIVNAGLDTAFCSGDSIRIGELTQSGFAYSWTPNTGLSSGLSSDPFIRLTNSNTGGASFTVPYNLTKVNSTTTCRNIDSLNVTVKPLPIANAGPTDTMVVCSKSSIQIGESGLPNHLYIWTPDSAITAANVSNPVLNINNPTQLVKYYNYTVRVTNSISTCKNSDQVVLSVNPLPIVPLSYIDTAVCSRDTIIIGGTSVNGYSYEWSPKNLLVDSTKSLTGFSAINNTDNPVSYQFNLLVKINATSCENNKLLTVRVNPLPDANAGPDKEVCSKDSIQIGLPPIAGRKYSWSPTAGLSNPDISNPKLGLVNNGTNNSTVTYTLSVTDLTTTTRCDSTDNVTVTIKPLPNVVAASDDTLAVCATLDLNLGITPDPTLNYQWSPATNLSSGTISNPLFNSSTSPGSAYLLYVLTAVNTGNQCRKSDSVNIFINPLPIVTLGTLDSLCSRDTIQIGPGNVLVPNSYQWNPTIGFVGNNPTNQTLTLTNNGNTVVTNPYRLIVRNIATQCADSATLNVRVNPLPDANAGLDRAICSGESTEIGKATEFGYGYIWQPSTGLSFQNISNPVFTMTQTGDPRKDTLVVTMTNSRTQCRKSDEVVVTTNPRPVPMTFGLYSPTVCPFTPNVNYSVTNSIPGNTYNWNVSGGSQTTGGNTNAVAVNWNGPNPNAKIVVTPTNGFGCVGTKDSIQLVINQNLNPVKPFGEEILCSYFKTGKIYSTVPTAGSNYTWRFLNATVDSLITSTGSVNIDWQTNNGIGKVWIQEQSNTIDPITGTPIQCFGKSDTLIVRINPSPDSTLNVNGLSSVCGGLLNRETLSLAGLSNSTYNWQINPQANVISGQGSDSLLVNWTTPGTYSVTVTETSDQGCLGRPISKPIVVNAIPVPGVSSLTNLNICPNDLQKGYFAASSPGFTNSTFTWAIEGGTAITPLTGGFLGVNWNNSGVYKITLTEISSDGCKKDTILPLNFDGSAVQLQNVSLFENDENQVQIKFNMVNQLTNKSDITVWRRPLGPNQSAWEKIKTGIPRNITDYIDAPGSTSTTAYQYMASTENICARTVESFPHNTILLKAAALQEEESAKLNWTPYIGWNGGVNNYSILRKVDKESGLSNFGSEAGNTLEKFYRVGTEGFEQCWRVIANENGGDNISYSNTVCVKFDNPLTFFNLFTPNGDGKNDKWEIRNLHLYPENELLIFDRWGGKVFKSTNYSNSDLWEGKDLAEGVYFYKFSLPKTGKEYNGWITIQRN